MIYTDFIGTVSEPNEDQVELISSRKDLSTPEHDYEKVRFGMPNGAISFKRVTKDRELLIGAYLSGGYRAFPSSKIDNKFKKHVAYFRACLDLWEQLCPERAFDKDEIYFRCLSEGLEFTEWVKKARSTSFRYHTSETDTSIEEEFLIRNYKGYNSLIHERYLINWEPEEVDDVKYAFIPRNEIDEHAFSKRVDKLFKDFRISDIEFEETLDMIKGLKNSVMYDPTEKGKRKTFLMRDFWSSEINPNGPYFATRRVIPVEAGNIRDTGVGDPSTILKVKQLNDLARVVSEHLPYCANAPENVCNSRLKRVLKRNAFLHVDFKKFGLTFPRQLTNIVIRKLGEISGIDVDHLIINDFFIEIDGETYHTERGSVLGWLDPINCIAVCAILHWLSCEEELGFDFITFNDDVEISKFAQSDLVGTLELLRLAVVAELNSFDIAISLDKTFGSKCSVFLERYAYYGNYDIDMYKEQLTVKAYAQSLVTEFPWQAKMFHAAAEQWTKNSYATDRCIMTCPIEFRPEEASLPLWAGGWFIWRKDKLDLSIASADDKGYLLGVLLSKFKREKYSLPAKKRDVGKIWTKINEKAYQAYSSEMATMSFQDMKTISELNSDIELIKRGLETFLFRYEGRNEQFPLRISWIANKALGVWDPGGNIQ